MVEAEFIDTLSHQTRIERIVENTITFLEKGKQVDLHPQIEIESFVFLAKFPLFASSNERKTTLRDIGLPAELLEKVRTEASAALLHPAKS